MTVEVNAFANDTYYVSSLKINDEFNIKFQYNANDENIKVNAINGNYETTVLVLDEDYKIINKNLTNGVYGVVRIIKDIDDVIKINIVRNVEISQKVVCSAQTIVADTIESALDKLTMIAQDNQFKDYTLHVSTDEDVSDNKFQLPPINVRANKIAGYGDYGEPTVYEGIDNVTRSLRQGPDELTDDSFILNINERAYRLLGFGAGGHVKYGKPNLGLTWENGVIDVKCSHGIEVTEDGLSIKISEGHGLSFMPGTDELFIPNGQGIISDGTGISVNMGEGITTFRIEPTDPGQLTLSPATQTTIGGVKIGEGLEVDEFGTVSTKPALFKSIGNGLQVDEEGQLSARLGVTMAYDLEGQIQVSPAREFCIGGVQPGFTTTVDSNGVMEVKTLPNDVVGSGLEKLSNGTIQVKIGASFGFGAGDILDLKPATASRLGGIKVGENCVIDEDGVLSVPSAGGITKDMIGDGLRLNAAGKIEVALGYYSCMDVQDFKDGYGKILRCKPPTIANPGVVSMGKGIIQNLEKLEANLGDHLKFVQMEGKDEDFQKITIDLDSLLNAIADKLYPVGTVLVLSANVTPTWVAGSWVEQTGPGPIEGTKYWIRER